MDELAYFRGWKDGCYDVARLIDAIIQSETGPALIAPGALDDLRDTIRRKGDMTLAIAEAALGEPQ